jgi:cell division transport system ATP-binding protein
VIDFQQVTKRYGSRMALNQVDFSIASGEMVFLTGHSGAGKTTLLRLILCLDKADSGCVLLGQRDLARVRERHTPYIRRQIGFVSQYPVLLSERRVFDNVAMPLIILGWPKQDISSRVLAALDKVNLRHRAQSFPHELSCGEQQRVGIARAIVHKPAILLADEPTGNLDPDLAEEIMGLFASFHEVGVTVFIATHALSLIASLPYRILTVEHGQVVGDVR